MRRGDIVRRRKIAARRRLFLPFEDPAIDSYRVRDQASLRAPPRSDDDIRARFSSPMVSDEISARPVAPHAIAEGGFAEPNRPSGRSRSTLPLFARDVANCAA